MEDELFTRDEVRSGILRVRKARALVYLIEQEAQRQRDRRAALRAMTVPFEGQGALSLIVEAQPGTLRANLPGEQDAAYIESYRNARRITTPAQFNTLCSTLDAWKVLIPEQISLRAELLHQLSIRHHLVLPKGRRLAAAFGVGTPAFDETYLALTGTEVAATFATEQGFLSRLFRRA